MGKLNWVVREAMPQGAGDASLSSATLPNCTIKDLQEANACLRRLLVHDIPITIQHIPLSELKLLIVADSFLHNAGGGSAQIALMICAAEEKLFDNKRVNTSILT